MAWNEAHKETFESILKLNGLSKEMADDIATQLCQIDNGRQDKLIAKWICQYTEKTKAEIR